MYAALEAYRQQLKTALKEYQATKKEDPSADLTNLLENLSTAQADYGKELHRLKTEYPDIPIDNAFPPLEWPTVLKERDIERLSKRKEWSETSSKKKPIDKERPTLNRPVSAMTTLKSISLIIPKGSDLYITWGDGHGDHLKEGEITHTYEDRQSKHRLRFRGSVSGWNLSTWVRHQSKKQYQIEDLGDYT